MDMPRLTKFFSPYYNILYKHAWSLLCWITAILIFCYCIHPARFASHYEYIPLTNMATHLEPAYYSTHNSCYVVMGNSATDNQLLYPNLAHTEAHEVLAKRLNILPGGQWRPKTCNPVYSVAIILPFRNREQQLNIFLNYIHPFLHTQEIEYTIFVIEQSSDKEFNRAKLFNIGFTEAIKINDFQCFIFHDIDLIPQNKANMYACSTLPRHMSSSVNTFRYNLPYKGLFGGVIAIQKRHFERVNGFSNVFFGWGGEDDDFYSRLHSKALAISRFSPSISQYYMLSHKKEEPSSSRLRNLEDGSTRYETDGLTNLQYKVLKHQLRPLSNWFLVEI